MQKILIIDDDPDVLTLLQVILKRKGYYTVTAVDEKQVFAQVAAEKPDLILLDVLLSGADGRNICRKLKAAAYKNIPVIMLSGHPAAQKGTRDYGADDFLAKPFREKEVLQKVERFLHPQSQPPAGQ